jgi:hypothetical protein
MVKSVFFNGSEFTQLTFRHFWVGSRHQRVLSRYLTVCLDRAIPDAPLSQVTQQCSTIAPKSRFATVKKSQEVFSSHFRQQ